MILYLFIIIIRASPLGPATQDLAKRSGLSPEGFAPSQSQSLNKNAV
jgi:hypothetical protein